MKDVPIIIPSAGRANAVLTSVDGAILFVPESEADAYAKCNPKQEIATHSDFAHKNLAEKRNEITRRWPNAFQIDDDIAFVSRLHLPGNNRATHLTSNEAQLLIQKTAQRARDAGCFLYGFNNTPNPKHYYPHKPIRLNSYINASAFGLWNSDKLYFTARTTAAESHWINLLNAYAHRKSYADMRFCFVQSPNSTFFRPGGQTAHRTMDSELSDTIFLRRMFGQAVRAKKMRGDAAKLHPYQRTIQTPL
jgi:hypothetical protein